MFDRKDITRLLAELYVKYSEIFEDKMPIISGMLEKLRPLLLEKDPYEVWDYFSLDASPYGNPVCIKVLTELRQRFNELMILKKIGRIEETGASDPVLGMKLLRETYAEALVHLRDDLLFILSMHAFDFCPKKPEWLINCSRLKNYLLQSRYVEAYPDFRDVAEDKALSAEIRSNAETTCGEILLYYFPYWPAAEKHFKNALSLCEKNIHAKRGMAQFYKKSGNLSGARELFMENILVEPHDYRSFNFIGDCFLDETIQNSKKQPGPDMNAGSTVESHAMQALKQRIRQSDQYTGKEKLSNEEFWYYAGWKAQFLQPISCRRLIMYYGRDEKSICENEEKITNLVEEATKLSWYPQEPDGYFSQPPYRGAFKDITAYNTNLGLGHCYQRAKLYSAAEDCYTEAIKCEPEYYAAYHARAYMYLQKNELENAEKDFRKILEFDENNYEGYWGLAYLHEMKKDPDTAIAMYLKCIAIRPDWSDWVENFIGNVYYDFDQLEKAIAYYRQAVAKNPDFKVYSDNLWNALTVSAQKLIESGNFAEGLEAYLSLARERNLASDWSRLGKLFIDKDDYGEAVKYYQKAINIDPDNAVVLEDLAALYEKMHLYTEFKNTMEEAIRVNKNDGRSLNKMGLFLQQQGDLEKALIRFVEALRLEPSNHRYLINIAACYEMNSGKMQMQNALLESALGNANIELENLEYDDFQETLRAIRLLYYHCPSLSFAYIGGWLAKFLLKEPSADTRKGIERDMENLLRWLIEQLNRHFSGAMSLTTENEWYLIAIIVQLSAEYNPAIVNPTLVATFFEKERWIEETNLLVTNYNYLPSDRMEDVIASIRSFAKSPSHVVYLSTLKSIVKLSVGDLKQFDLSQYRASNCYIDFDFEGNEDKIIIENFNADEIRQVYTGMQKIEFTREVILLDKKYIRKWWTIFEQVLSNQIVQ